MADITSVIISAESSGVDKAAKSLDNLVSSADNAEKSVSNLNTSTGELTSTQNTSQSSIDKLLQSYQKRADLLGSNVAQQNAYNAALKGASAAQQSAATFLGAEVDAYKALSAAQTEANRMNAQLTASQQATTQAGQQFLNTLNDMVAKTTLSGQALKDYNAGLLTARAAELGVSDAAQRMIESLNQTGTSAGGAHTGIAGITRELIVVGHEAMTGNFSRIPGSFVVLAEKVDLSAGIVRGLTAATEALDVSMTTLLVGAGAIVAVLGFLAIAAASANNDFKLFNNALLLTGNYAGTTVAGLNDIARASVASGGSISEARTIIAGLASTGKLTADQISLIAPALVEFSHATGGAADDVEKSFEKIADSATNTTSRSKDAITRAVLEMNSQYHLLNAAQLEQVASLEQVGKSEEAVAAAMSAMSATLKTRSEEAASSFTPLGKAIDEIGKKAQTAWETIKSIYATRIDNSALVQSLQDRIDVLTQAGGSGNLKKAQELQDQINSIQVAGISKSTEAYLQGEQTQTTNAQQYATLRFHNAVIANNSQQAAVEALARFDLDFQNQTQSQQLQGQAEYEATRLILVKATQDKVKKVRAEGLSDINADLAAIANSYAGSSTDIANSLKLNDDAYKKGTISLNQQVEERAVLLTTQALLIKSQYDDEIAAATKSMNTQTRTTAEKAELSGKIQELSRKETDLLAANTLAQQENGSVLQAQIDGVYKKQLDSNQKTNDSIQKQIDAINAQVAAYNSLTDNQKAAGVTDKQLQDSITASYIANKQAELAQAIENNDADDKIAQAYIAGLKEQIDLLGQKGQAQKALESNEAANKAIIDYNTKWKEANKQIGDDLASAIIDGGGKGWKKLITDMETAFAKVILQPILAPISGALASLTTSVGASSPAGVGAASSAVSLASTASSLYSAISKGFSGIGDSVAGGVQKAFNFLGTSDSQTIGNSLNAQAVGSIAESVAGFAVGKTLDSLISGKYQISSGVSTVETVATAVASAFGPIAGSITGAVSGLLNRAFGHGPEEVTSQGIRGTVSGTATTGEAYQNIHADGGWFSSDINKTNTQGLSSDVSNSLTSGVAALESASSGFAKSLGVSTDALTNYSKAFDITLTGDVTKDQAAIATFISSVGDDIANKLVPNLSDFAQVGETASATLQRLSETFTATDAVAALLGKTGTDAFGAIGLASAATRQALVDIAGGISNLGSEVTFFAANFETAAEQIAPTQKAVTDALAALGESNITTIAQYDALVKGIDLSTSAGQELFQNLMALAPAFKQVADATAALTAAQQKITDQQHQEDIDLLTAQGNAQAVLNIQRQDELAALALLDPSLVATQQKIYDITDAATAFTNAQKSASNAFAIVSKSVNDAKDAATDAYNAQTDVINNQITSVTNINTAISSLASTVQSALDSMVQATAVTLPTLASAQASLDNALTQAKAGNFVTADSLKDPLSTLGKDNSGLFSSSTEYAKEQGITAGKLADLNELTGAAKTVSDQQLDTLKDSLTVLKNQYDAQTKAYDQILSAAQAQLDAVNGTTVAVQSVADALSAFNVTIAAAIEAAKGQAAAQGGTTTIGSGQTTPSTPATDSDIVSLYKNLLGRTPDAAGLAFWEQAAKNGVPLSSITNDFLTSPEYLAAHAVNGSHAGGLDSVPFDGYTAKLHKGEMVLPATQAKGVAQADDMKDLIEAINSLKSDNSAENQGTIGAVMKLYKLVRDMAPDGDRIQTNEVGTAVGST